MKGSTLTAGLTILVVVVVLGVYALIGALALWSLNTLFTLGLAYSAKNIIAAMILSGLVAHPPTKKST